MTLRAPTSRSTLMRSISYKWSPKLELTLEGVNLTNQANDQFISRALNSSVATP